LGRRDPKALCWGPITKRGECEGECEREKYKQ
jgi:hypothetical protein